MLSLPESTAFLCKKQCFSLAWQIQHWVHSLPPSLKRRKINLNLPQATAQKSKISNIIVYICRRLERETTQRKITEEEEEQPAARKLLTKRATYQPFLQSLPFSCWHYQK